MHGDMLTLQIPDGSWSIGYANDLVIVVTARNTEMLEIVANEAMRQISNWIGKNGLKLAVHITEAMLITDRRIYRVPSFSLTLVHRLRKFVVNASEAFPPEQARTVYRMLYIIVDLVRIYNIFELRYMSNVFKRELTLYRWRPKIV